MGATHLTLRPADILQGLHHQIDLPVVVRGAQLTQVAGPAVGAT
ncbi:hypothetical protein [Nocardioides panzhihuensis]|uniref:Uncharacterized protein n=1 Tax=Nocardioides panzhihuensis TaxID=860243 RepID=A0A7Z0DHM3_9ACTN|nr:hypothetical protein [Nocardioides panzhihuensis]NYI75477.1 hypothetical protein [Nocardioides panzhihuensis]